MISPGLLAITRSRSEPGPLLASEVTVSVAARAEPAAYTARNTKRILTANEGQLLPRAGSTRVARVRESWFGDSLTLYHSRWQTNGQLKRMLQVISQLPFGT